MANDTDHQFVSELMDLVHQLEDERVMSGRNRTPSTFRRIFDIVLWSSISNLILLGVFVAGWNSEEIRNHVRHWLPSAVAGFAASAEPAPVLRPELQDNELLTRGPQRQLKGPLQITLVPSSEADVPQPEAAPVAVAVADDATVAEPDQGDGSGDITVGPEDPAAQLSRSPLLRRGQKSGDVEIGNFATVSLPGSSAECLDTAYSLLDDAGATRDKLKVLAESNMITVARICAANGSLVVTCRMDQITISPRRLKPNETCTG